jgi:peptidoglycan/xylan/chitin deacetylase (PgdA/CDA1 family)
VVRNFVKSTIRASLNSDAFPWKVVRSLRSGTIVLGYHGVAADESITDPWIQRSQTPLSEFRSHLEFIGKHFEVVSADQCLENPSAKRQVHLTFDDGYTGFAEHAVPAMSEFGFPASVYVVSEALSNQSKLPPFTGRAAIGHCSPGQISLDSVGLNFNITDRASRMAAYSELANVLKTGNPTAVSTLIDELTALLPADKWDDLSKLYETENLMDWNALQKVSKSGFTVGAHTQTHLSLSNLQTDSDIEQEVQGSIEAVRRELGSCDWFAYPNGTTDDWSQTAAKAVKNAKGKGAWTLERGVIRNPESIDQYRLPRFFIPRSHDRFRLLMNTASIRN